MKKELMKEIGQTGWERNWETHIPYLIAGQHDHILTPQDRDWAWAESSPPALVYTTGQLTSPLSGWQMVSTPPELKSMYTLLYWVIVESLPEKWFPPLDCTSQNSAKVEVESLRKVGVVEGDQVGSTYFVSLNHRHTFDPDHLDCPNRLS